MSSPTCTNTIPARLGVPAHVCGKPAKYVCSTEYTGEHLWLCEECLEKVPTRTTFKLGNL